MTATRIVYLHGFASSRDSHKGVALEARLADLPCPFERLDLRTPSLERLRVSAMLDVARRALDAGGPVVLAGSSLGGLAAALCARHPSVARLVLLAPAFRLLDRWRARLGAVGWSAWEEADALPIDDYATGRRTTVDFGFVRDLARVVAERGDPPALVKPTTILHGLRDDAVPIEGSRAAAAGRAGVTLVELDDDHELRASLDPIERALRDAVAAT